MFRRTKLLQRLFPHLAEWGAEKWIVVPIALLWTISLIIGMTRDLINYFDPPPPGSF
jgi:hypothetical protein